MFLAKLTADGDPDGGGVANAEIRIRRADPLDGRWFVRRPSSISDAAGRFVVDRLLAVDHELHGAVVDDDAAMAAAARHDAHSVVALTDQHLLEPRETVMAEAARRPAP